MSAKDQTTPQRSNNNNRRNFLKTSTTAAVGTTLLGTLPISRMAHGAGSERLKIGLVGAGGRGTGAAVDALSADPGNQLTAIGDVFIDQARNSLNRLRADASVGSQVDVSEDYVFGDFDAYKNVIDSGIDVVILTTSPHFRPEHFDYAVEAGKHCFVEKPVAVDAPGVRHMYDICDRAQQKGLAVVSGLCWRYDQGVRETMQRIQDGAIGEIMTIHSAYNAGTLWHRGDKPEWSRMEYQIRNWLYYTWLSGDHIVEQAVHSLDKCAWLMGDASPVRATGMGGRQQRTDPKYGHIFDHHSVIFDFESSNRNVKVFFTCRQQDGCTNYVDETVLGTKGTAQILKHRIEGENSWHFRNKKQSMYRVEHQELFRSVRDGNPINNGHYMNNSTMMAILGRMCTYTGQSLAWEEALNSQEHLGPSDYAWTDVPEPEVAIPGLTKFI